MKTIRVSDETHKKLTEILGKLTAESGKMQTYDEVISILIAAYNFTDTKTSKRKVGVG
ncbi:MAG: hypothetical protein NDP23_05270 [Crenarchaeota archaeon]|nr:hypothetical protein [Thermoproteota archaeon]